MNSHEAKTGGHQKNALWGSVQFCCCKIVFSKLFAFLALMTFWAEKLQRSYLLGLFFDCRTKARFQDGHHQEMKNASKKSCTFAFSSGKIFQQQILRILFLRIRRGILVMQDSAKEDWVLNYGTHTSSYHSQSNTVHTGRVQPIFSDYILSQFMWKDSNKNFRTSKAIESD